MRLRECPLTRDEWRSCGDFALLGCARQRTMAGLGLDVLRPRWPELVCSISTITSSQRVHVVRGALDSHDQTHPVPIGCACSGDDMVKSRPLGRAARDRDDAPPARGKKNGAGREFGWTPGSPSLMLRPIAHAHRSASLIAIAHRHRSSSSLPLHPLRPRSTRGCALRG